MKFAAVHIVVGVFDQVADIVALSVSAAADAHADRIGESGFDGLAARPRRSATQNEENNAFYDPCAQDENRRSRR